jgi:hypothetical protein
MRIDIDGRRVQGLTTEADLPLIVGWTVETVLLRRCPVEANYVTVAGGQPANRLRNRALVVRRVLSDVVAPPRGLGPNPLLTPLAGPYRVKSAAVLVVNAVIAGSGSRRREQEGVAKTLVGIGHRPISHSGAISHLAWTIVRRLKPAIRHQFRARQGRPRRRDRGRYQNRPHERRFMLHVIPPPV